VIEAPVRRSRPHKLFPGLGVHHNRSRLRPLLRNLGRLRLAIRGHVAGCKKAANGFNETTATTWLVAER
jgi:hypothetical protein